MAERSPLVARAARAETVGNVACSAHAHTCHCQTCPRRRPVLCAAPARQGRGDARQPHSWRAGKRAHGHAWQMIPAMPAQRCDVHRRPGRPSRARVSRARCAHRCPRGGERCPWAHALFPRPHKAQDAPTTAAASRPDWPWKRLAGRQPTANGADPAEVVPPGSGGLSEQAPVPGVVQLPRAAWHARPPRVHATRRPWARCARSQVERARPEAGLFARDAQGLRHAGAPATLGAGGASERYLRRFRRPPTRVPMVSLTARAFFRSSSCARKGTCA